MAKVVVVEVVEARWIADKLKRGCSKQHQLQRFGGSGSSSSSSFAAGDAWGKINGQSTVGLCCESISVKGKYIKLYYLFLMAHLFIYLSYPQVTVTTNSFL